jgi:hypothetical protein
MLRTILLATVVALTTAAVPSSHETVVAGDPTRHYDRVLARSTDVYHRTFTAGAVAAVWVKGDGDTDLDCYVYDSNGYFIDSDVDSTDSCLMRWVPLRTGSFRIEIRNLGAVYNDYVIETTE